MGIVPLDEQVGVEVPETVPNALSAPLFGQPEPTETESAAAGGDRASVPSLQTYAILDAAKIEGLPEMLEASGLEHRCLFKGSAFDELQDVAPWLVRLEKDSAFTRNLFTRGDAPWHLWDREPGLYVRSRAAMNELWAHFRKFTKVQDEHGRWIYFRFWEPDIASVHLDYLRGSYGATQQWFRPRTGHPVAGYLVIRRDGCLSLFAPLPADHQVAIGPSFKMTDAEIARFRDVRVTRFIHDIAERLRAHVPDRASDVLPVVMKVAEHFGKQGFRRKSSLVRLSWWQLHLGDGFEKRVDPGKLQIILDPKRDEDMRIADLAREIERAGAP